MFVLPGDAVAEDGTLGVPCCWGDCAGAAPPLPSGLAGTARPDAAAAVASLDLAEGDLLVRRLLGGSDPSPAAFRRNVRFDEIKSQPPLVSSMVLAD